MVIAKATVNLDDRFVKIDAPSIVWVVSSLLNVADPVPHVLLVQEGLTNRKITLSIPALRDASIYRKIEPKQQAD